MVLCPNCGRVLDKVVYESVEKVEYDLETQQQHKDVLNVEAYCGYCDMWLPLYFVLEKVLFAKCPSCGSAELELSGPVKGEVKLECKKCGQHFWVRL